jgi:Amt family ammonium transporter
MSLSELPELVGFFSYSREDDEYPPQALSRLRERIQQELRSQLGRRRSDFRIWQDKTAIAHGKLWENEIQSAIAQSVFFVPIVTPTAIKSQHCKFEFEAFLRREADLGRNDLVFPILYIRVPALEDEGRWRADSVLNVIGTRQYIDWQSLRHLDIGSTDVGIAIERFCRNIFDALQRPCIAPEERRRREQEPRNPAEGERPNPQLQGQTEEAERRKSAEFAVQGRVPEEQHGPEHVERQWTSQAAIEVNDRVALSTSTTTSGNGKLARQRDLAGTNDWPRQQLTAVALLIGMGMLAIAVTAAITIYDPDSVAVSTYTCLMLVAVPGFALFHAGLKTPRISVPILLRRIVGGLAVIAFLWMVAGYSLAFRGENPLIGTLERVFFAGMKADQPSPFAPNLPELLFALLNMAIALVTAAIVLESVADRMRVSTSLLFNAAWLLLVFVPIAHWIWGAGFLAQAGILDFAGGSVIHLNAGVTGIVATLTLGSAHHSSERNTTSNLPLAVIGLGLIWLGWIGITGGASLAASSRGTLAMLVTNIAACVGALTWIGLEWATRGRPSVLGFMFGVIAGLAGITPASGFVLAWHAVILGVIVSALCFFTCQALYRRQRAPAVDLFAVHAVGGAAGLLLTGVFAVAALSAATGTQGFPGLLEGNPHQLLLQTYGVVVIPIWAGVVTFVWLRLTRSLSGSMEGQAATD